METSKRNNDAADALSSPTNPAHWYAYASSLYLILLSLPLLLFPRLLLLLSTPRGAVGQPASSSDSNANAISAIGPELTPLERYGSHANAISMLAMAALILVLSGAIPVTTAPMPDSSSAGKSPFRIPTVVVTALFFAANAFTAWSQSGPRTAKDAADPAQLGIGTFGKVVGLTHALFAFWGFGVFMFGNDLTRNRKKAGDQDAKDKSVSGFPFKNQYAAEEKAKKSS